MVHRLPGDDVATVGLTQMHLDRRPPVAVLLSALADRSASARATHLRHRHTIDRSIDQHVSSFIITVHVSSAVTLTGLSVETDQCKHHVLCYYITY